MPPQHTRTFFFLGIYYLLRKEMNNLPDIDSLRSQPGSLPQPPARATRPPRRQSGWFIRGPIPGQWIGEAAKLPGKSLHVALAILYLAGMNKDKGQPVALCRRTLALFGVGQRAGREALTRLDAAGLVSVVRRSGYCPRVTVLTCAKSQG